MAYVTLKPGMSASSEELVDAARELVPERAAVPVRIEILEQMALTAVGKIAKAVLRMRAAESVFRQTLAAENIPATVRVRADVRHGTVADVQCAAPDAARVLELLGCFSVHVEVSQPA